MELRTIKDIMFQTKCGALIREGMGCSEPLPVLTEDGIADNFFLYMYSGNTNTFSAPVARMQVLTEQKKMVYFVSCYDKPFSRLPEETMQGKSTKEQRLANYHNYERLYNEIRPLVYTNCTEKKALLIQFMNAFKKFIDPVLLKFYVEMSPEFFEWYQAQTQISEKGEGENGKICD